MIPNTVWGRLINNLVMRKRPWVGCSRAWQGSTEENSHPGPKNKPCAGLSSACNDGIENRKEGPLMKPWTPRNLLPGYCVQTDVWSRVYKWSPDLKRSIQMFPKLRRTDKQQLWRKAVVCWVPEYYMQWRHSMARVSVICACVCVVRSCVCVECASYNRHICAMWGK